MKKIFITTSLFIISLFFLYSCKKTKLVTASITGFDATKCGCCHGYVISVNGHQLLAQDNLANLFPVLNDSNIQYPIAIKMDYKSASNNCSNKIEILTIQAK